MKDIILNYIIQEFGESDYKTKHYSYCMYPEEACTCKNLEVITYDTPLITGGYIDSFSMVCVWHFLEKTFGVTIPDIAATPENFNTVNKMVELVEKYR